MNQSNNKGQEIKHNDTVTVTTREGDRVSGEVKGGANGVVYIRSGGYTYHGDAPTTEIGDTSKRKD